MSTEKVCTLIIESNLECEKCYRKIQKVLCKLQDKERIRSINFDTSKNIVTISGPFDAQKLSRKLRCKAGEAIKDITEKKPEPKKEEKKTEPTKEVKKPADEKKPADACCKCCKKPDDKKPEEKKPADACCKCCKKPDDKKPEEKTKPEEKKKTEEKPKPKEETKAAPAPSGTTVNLQFTQVCNLCYPWPCSDPSHWGGVHQHPQPQPLPQQPQWPCEPPPAMPAFPGHQHHPYPPWAAPPMTPKRQPCGGPSYCGGCGSCGGGGGYNGWPPAMPTPLQMMQPPPMGCGGPASSCRGCKGCRIVQEGRFIYEEYPPSACSVM